MRSRRIGASAIAPVAVQNVAVVERSVWKAITEPYAGEQLLGRPQLSGLRHAVVIRVLPQEKLLIDAISSLQSTVERRPDAFSIRIIA
jgi:hypothetical protein